MKIYDFSKICRDTLVGELVRFPLRFIPKNISLPILQGPNKGYKWIVGGWDSQLLAWLL